MSTKGPGQVPADPILKDATTDADAHEPPANLEDIQAMLTEALVSEPTLRLLPKFKMAQSGNPDFHRIYFSVHCTCGTAGLLSVETAKSKTLSEVKDAAPTLKQHLVSRAKQFAGMSCAAHTQMRTAGIKASMATSENTSAQEPERS